MGRPLLRLTHPATGQVVYCEWVSSCDAPGYSWMTLDEVGEYLDEWATEPLSFAFNRGPEAASDAEFEVSHRREVNKRRLKRLDARGHSMCDEPMTPERYVAFNRAGPGEKQIDLSTLCDLLIERAAQS